MANRVELTPVYVLHTRPFQNTSLIVELLSEQYGRVTVVARSARGPRSRFRGQLQLFTPMLASWFGLHELKTLTQIELNGVPVQLDEHPLFCGFYFNELLMRLLHKEDPHPDLFHFYHQSLLQLQSKMTLAPTLRLFEKKLLETLGYALPLHYEAKTHLKISENQNYYFVPRQGFFSSVVEEQPACLFSGADIIGLAQERFMQESVLSAAKRLNGMVIADLLGEKPLNSRLFFKNQF